MSNHISQANFIRGLFLALEETFEHVHGIYLDKGASLFETLATISAAEASQPVGGQCATLAAQVEHVNFYLEVLERFLVTGTNAQVDWNEIWHRVKAVTPTEWAAAQHKLKQTYQRLLSTIRNYNGVWDNDQAVSGAMGLVAHSAYHLGEIRQALCALRAP